MTPARDVPIVANPMAFARAHGPRLETDSEAERTRALHPLAPWEAFALRHAPMQRGKILLSLARPLRHKGEVRPRHAHILRLHLAGVRVRTEERYGETTTRAWWPNGSTFLDESDLTKTGFDFLRWLETAVST